MTCKDCVHYKVCKNNYDTRLEEFDLCGNFDDYGKRLIKCDHFKDKSRFIERLFDVGDKIYQTDDDGRIYEMTINRIEYYKGTKQLIYETCAISFDNNSVGHSIFGTKEEAEKALKERKKND